MLQSSKSKFDRTGKIEPTCKLCKMDNEDLRHFLLYCPKLNNERERFMDLLKEKIGETIYNEMKTVDDQMLQLETVQIFSS